MKVTTETRMGPACVIGQRTIRIVEKRQAISSGASFFLSSIPIGIWVTEGESEYYYSLSGTSE